MNNNLETQIRKILPDMEYASMATDKMVSIQLNRKDERLIINTVDIADLERLGLKLWAINLSLKTLTFDIVKKGANQ